MAQGPPVIVTFYSNFHFIEVDVSGVFVNVGVGHEVRTFLVKEDIFENVGGHLEFVETKEFTENINVIYYSAVMRVSASSGTWSVTFNHLAEKSTHYTSGAIDYLFDATAVRAAVSTSEFDADPGTLHAYRRTTIGGTSEIEAGDPVFANVLDRPDLGANAVEMRIYVASGLEGAEHEASVLGTDIDLGPVWELRPAYDETGYRVLLEEGDCGAAGVPEPEPGALQIENPCSGRKATFHGISGHRS